ncbi:hypothetical protein D3C80_1919670 [compost metagenome]
MLDSTRDTNGNIQVRTDGTTGLTHVLVVRTPVCISYRTATSQGSIHSLSQIFQDTPVFRALQTTTTRYHALSFAQWNFTFYNIFRYKFHTEISII